MTGGGGKRGVPGDCTGNEIPNAAKFTGSLTANYNRQIYGGELRASANVYYTSGYYATSDNVLKGDRHALLNATVRWISDGGFSIGLIGRNLTDRRAEFVGTPLSNGSITSRGFTSPRTVAVELGYRF